VGKDKVIAGGTVPKLLRYTFADLNPVAHHLDDAELQIEFHARMLPCFHSCASFAADVSTPAALGLCAKGATHTSLGQRLMIRGHDPAFARIPRFRESRSF
jgi:hypothetical protein